LWWKPQGTKPRVGTPDKWQDCIKVDYKGAVSVFEDDILVQLLSTFKKTVLRFPGSIRADNLLTSWKTTSFSRTTLHNGVRVLRLEHLVSVGDVFGWSVDVLFPIKIDTQVEVLPVAFL
jgi:hypothetical protein